MDDTDCVIVVPVDTLAVASLKVRLDSALVNAPCAGFVMVELFCQETETDGEAVPVFHNLAVKDNVNPVIVDPELFCNNHVAFPLVAVPLPKKDKFKLPYHPPAAFVVWPVPCQFEPFVPDPTIVQLAGEFAALTAVAPFGAVNALKFSIKAVADVTLT